MSADPAAVLDCIEGFRRSKMMFAATRLGVFDALEGRIAPAGELAAELGCQDDSLERLLDACVALGLLQKMGGAYSNSPAASCYLARSSPDSLAGYALYSDSALYALWGRLEDAVRQGSNRWEQVFGGQENFFANVYGSREGMREFLAGMHGFGRLSSPAVIAAVDLGGFRTLVDVGGASGHLAIEACRCYPELRAVVFDLPPVGEVAREAIEASGMAGRIEFVAGDFFHDPLPPADVFALGRILHDWDESRVGLLLDKCFAALPPGGALLVAERLLNEEKTGPAGALLQSLNMLVGTHGRERTASEYKALLKRAGFDRVVARVTGSPLDAVFTRKP